MKLTVKIEAKEKIRGFVRDFEDYGRINRPFDTKDFVELERAVILTVEESKKLSKLIKRIEEDICLTENEMNTWKRLKERIEQAEKCSKES